MNVYHLFAGDHGDYEKVLGSPRVGVTGSCELLDLGAGNHNQQVLLTTEPSLYPSDIFVMHLHNY